MSGNNINTYERKDIGKQNPGTDLSYPSRRDSKRLQQARYERNLVVNARSYVPHPHTKYFIDTLYFRRRFNGGLMNNPGLYRELKNIPTKTETEASTQILQDNISSGEGFRTWYNNASMDSMLFAEIRKGKATTTLIERQGWLGSFVDRGTGPVTNLGKNYKIKDIRNVKWRGFVHNGQIISQNKFSIVFDLKPSYINWLASNKEDLNDDDKAFIHSVFQHLTIDKDTDSDLVFGALERYKAECKPFVLANVSSIVNGKKMLVAYSFKGRTEVLTLWCHGISFYGRRFDAIEWKSLAEVETLVNVPNDTPMLIEGMTRLPKIPYEGTPIHRVAESRENDTDALFAVLMDNSDILNPTVGPSDIMNPRPQKFRNPSFTKGCGFLIFTINRSQIYMLLLKRREFKETMAYDGKLGQGWTIPFGKNRFVGQDGTEYVANPFLQAFYELEEEYFMTRNDVQSIEARLGQGNPARKSFLEAVLKGTSIVVHDHTNMYLVSYISHLHFKRYKGDFNWNDVVEGKTDFKGKVWEQAEIGEWYTPFGAEGYKDSEMTFARVINMSRLSKDVVDNPANYDRFMFQAMTVAAAIFESTELPVDYGLMSSKDLLKPTRTLIDELEYQEADYKKTIEGEKDLVKKKTKRRKINKVSGTKVKDQPKEKWVPKKSVLIEES